MSGLAPDLVRGVEEAYALPRLLLEAAEQKPGQGTRLWLRDGDGSRYLLKTRPEYVLPTEYAVEIELHLEALAAGAPVVSLARTATGEAWTTVDGKQVSLQHVVAGGRVARADPEDARLFGGCLAAFGAAVAPLLRWPAGDWSFPEGRTRWLPDLPTTLRNTVRFFAAEPGVSPRHVHALDAVAEVAWRSCDLTGVPAAFVHGDASPLNCVLADGEAWLVDLDEMRWGLPLFDLLQGLCTVAAVDYVGDRSVLRDNWAEEPARAYLDAFLRRRDPTPAEARAAKPFLQLVLIRIGASELDLDDPRMPRSPDLGEQVERLVRLLGRPTPLDDLLP